MYRRTKDDYEKAINAGSPSSYIPFEDAEGELTNEVTPEDIIIRKQIFATASEEALSVIKLILSMPPSIMEAVRCANSPRTSRQRVRKYLQARTNMPKEEIDTVFAEIKLRLSLA
jgi:hypothetical protein